MGLRFLQSTPLFPDVHWAIPSRAKTEMQSQHTGAVFERTDLGQWGKNTFTYIHIFQSNKDLQRPTKGRKRSAEIMKKEIINLSLDLHLTCSEGSSNVAVLFATEVLSLFCIWTPFSCLARRIPIPIWPQRYNYNQAPSNLENNDFHLESVFLIIYNTSVLYNIVDLNDSLQGHIGNPSVTHYLPGKEPNCREKTCRRAVSLLLIGLLWILIWKLSLFCFVNSDSWQARK